MVFGPMSQSQKSQRECDTCGFKEFAVVNGLMVCLRCNVEQADYLEEGQESFEDGLNKSRTKRIRLEAIREERSGVVSRCLRWELMQLLFSKAVHVVR